MSQSLSYSDALHTSGKRDAVEQSRNQRPPIRMVKSRSATRGNLASSSNGPETPPTAPNSQRSSTRLQRRDLSTSPSNRSNDAQPSAPQSSNPPAANATHASESAHPHHASESHRAAFHTPATGHDESTHYILTLQISLQLHHFLTALRDAHFPKRANRLSAHISMFRALPGSKLAVVRAAVAEVCERFGMWEVAVDARGVFRMGKGVGVGLGKGAGKAKTVQASLKEMWMKGGVADGGAGEGAAEVDGGGWLSEQDRMGWRPHATVMNKVEDAAAVDKALEDVRGEVEKREHDQGGKKDMAEGLGLYEYDKGHWNFVERWEFAGKE